MNAKLVNDHGIIKISVNGEILDAVGSYQVFYNGLCVASVPLFAHNASPTVPAVQPRPEPVADPEFDLGGLIMAGLLALGSLVALVLLFFGGMLIYNRVRAMLGKQKNRKRQADRRSERRRSR